LTVTVKTDLQCKREESDRVSENRPAELSREARALLDAVVAIGSDLDLARVLRRIVESACALTNARYGVLATVDQRGAFTELITHGLTPEEQAAIGRMPVGHGLLGAVPRRRTPMRVEHVSRHPESTGFPAAHPPIDRFLGAPVLVDGVAFGHLYLGDPADAQPFTEHDEALVEALAGAAGVLIDNARRFDESERRRAWLEASVRINAALAPTLRTEASLQRLVEEVRDVAAAEAVLLVQQEVGPVEVAAVSGEADGLLVQLDEELRRTREERELLVRGEDDGSATLMLPIASQVAAPGVLVVHHSRRWAALREMERDLIVGFADGIGLALDRAAAVRERQELLLAKDRDRIARDLHDLVVQRLYATGMQLAAARNASDDELRRLAAEAVGEVDQAMGDLRATVFELRRGSGSVRQVVRSLVTEYADVLGFLPSLRFVGQVDTALSASAADDLVLTLREALSNVAKHASATAVAVELEAGATWFTLRVTDDGVGLAHAGPDSDEGGPVGVTGHGLGNVRHRAERLGGEVRLLPGPTGGTRLEWVVPAV